MNISKFYVHQEVRDHVLVRRFQKRLKRSPTVVADVAEVYRQVLSCGDPIGAGKQTLFLTRNRGAFLRECPGTRNYLCCGYRILHIGTYCTMDCAYCILQSYFHPPLLQFFVNQDDMYAELEGFFAQPGVKRIGTGEFTDSLIWQAWTDLSGELVDRFARQENAVLELKTKTTAVAALAHRRHNRKTITAWSLNTPRVISSEERGTASLEARLKSARRCEQWGYPLAFHFDPMVIYEGCRREYLQVIDQLFRTVSAENVVWISLGTFRFMPALKAIIEERFPRSKIAYGEFIGGLDGKMRYFKRLRIGLYRSVVEHIRAVSPDVTIYFCMEDDEVWQQVFGFTPRDPDGIGEMLDRSATRPCGLKV
jgi:spore photoproduct lyase